MLTRLKIRTKLLVYFLSVAIVPFIVIGMFSFFEIHNILSAVTFERLVGIREAKKSELESFFEERQADMKILSQNIGFLYKHTIEELKAIQANRKNQVEWYFEQQFKDIDVFSKRQCVLQTLNTFDEPQTDTTPTITLAVTKQKLDYQLTHYAHVKGYYDILFINPKGDIIYSIKKNAELNKHVSEFQNTALYEAFQRGKEKVSLQDFTVYPPTNQQQVAFFSAPIIDEHDQLLGVLIFSILPDQLNNIVNMQEGMDKTGKTYLIGKANGHISYRSDRVIKQPGSKQLQIEQDIESALLGKRDVKVKINSDGRLELVAYIPLTIPQLHWAMVSTIDLEEIISPQLKNNESYLCSYIKRYNYYDLFLIHPEGEIFYTVMHENDFGTNILHGKYKDTKLNEVVQSVLQNKEFSISDYALYTPSNHEPSAFMAYPLLENGEIIFIVALRFTDSTLNEIMYKREGMGKTGESYLVGSDYLMRSNSYLSHEYHSMRASFANSKTGSANTDSVKKALAGEKGYGVTTDYQGNTVFSAYTPLKIGNFTWALLTEISEEEALASVKLFERLLIIIALVVMSITLFIILRFSQSIVLPLKTVYSQLTALSKGIMSTQHITYQAQDEIGGIINAAHLLNQSMQHTIEQANSIADGQYQNDVKLLSKDDQLGKSLMHMTQQLRKMTVENESRNWLKTGQTRLNDQMRGEQDIYALANKIIRCLTDYVNAQAGAFYLANAKGEDTCFQLIATQGYSQRKQLAQEYLLGEGLVGQAALEKELIIVSPPSTINLVNDFEVYAAAIPLIYEENVQGVIELYTLNILNDLEIEFLSQVISSISITIHSVEMILAKKG